MKIKVKKLHPDAILPRYATDGAACFDLHCFAPDTVPSLMGQEVGSATFPTGLAFEIPQGHVMLVYSRSGHGFKHGISLANSVGVIDSDYRGELMVRLSTAPGYPPLPVGHGDRIAQAMILPIQAVELEEVAELTDTERGAGGFGSTGT